jgi:hypothetical protein
VTEVGYEGGIQFAVSCTVCPHFISPLLFRFKPPEIHPADKAGNAALGNLLFRQVKESRPDTIY